MEVKDHLDFSFDEAKRTLDDISSYAQPVVVLSGGEPLLRKDLELCGREIRKRGMRWSLVTNGHLYDEKRHISLLNSGL